MLALIAFAVGCTCCTLGREDLGKIWMGVSLAMGVAHLEAMWRYNGGTWSSFFALFSDETYGITQPTPKVFKPKKVYGLKTDKAATTTVLYKSAVEIDKEEKAKKAKIEEEKAKEFHLLNPQPQELDLIAQPLTNIELGIIPPSEVLPAATPLQITLDGTNDNVFNDGFTNPNPQPVTNPLMPNS